MKVFIYLFIFLTYLYVAYCAPFPTFNHFHSTLQRCCQSARVPIHQLCLQLKIWVGSKILWRLTADLDFEPGVRSRGRGEYHRCFFSLFSMFLHVSTAC